ncbi:MAG: peptide chain release factor 1 [Candidatus Riflebacteria bacterium]|nr:peptide chain release factor 1 [Candidatus Riflebacteria bacterium]
MLHKLEAVNELYLSLTEKLSDPKLPGNPAEYQKTAKKRAEIEPVHNAYEEYLVLKKQLDDARAMLQNESASDLKELAQEEIDSLEPVLRQKEKDLKFLLIPKDADDSKNTIVEVRAGTGGEEAALFAAVLYRMYTRYAENKGWKCELLSMNDTGIGGLKEAIFSIDGKDVYGRLKYESGVHRVQRVPVTEASGRIHTSAATVAVLPEAEEVDVTIDEKDLRIDVFRSSGPGGQSVNTTDSAVRVTHIPTGIVISCQDEKSQHKNKAKALRILRARLLDQAKSDQERSRSDSRKTQVGSGDRSERIRTYNFPQQRLTDHRIGLTLYKLTDIVEGNLDEVIDSLIEADNLKKLATE